ncbi:phage antirepressor KilAC domain-containing protein [uncultured Draconibacterium sp.]|uniref:phage antirepressor KilAC domain-containing protein n=1 Tax=uncultured Draconibacterium sp. TaxID=1573823 RepID=UPI002AA80CED|nr:phage antirepressor KilAC domain-containing protein [uncultured Draconibacterium sp.]
MENLNRYNLSQAARILNIKSIGRSKIYKILRKLSIVDETNKPFQRFIDEGYLDFGLPTIRIPGFTVQTPVTLVVGERGLEFLRNVIEGYLKENQGPVIYKRKSKRITFDGDSIIIEDAFEE